LVNLKNDSFKDSRREVFISLRLYKTATAYCKTIRCQKLDYSALIVRH
jgi:hypothetical protein